MKKSLSISFGVMLAVSLFCGLAASCPKNHDAKNASLKDGKAHKSIVRTTSITGIRTPDRHHYADQGDGKSPDYVAGPIGGASIIPGIAASAIVGVGGAPVTSPPPPLTNGTLPAGPIDERFPMIEGNNVLIPGKVIRAGSRGGDFNPHEPLYAGNLEKNKKLLYYFGWLKYRKADLDSSVMGYDEVRDVYVATNMVGRHLHPTQAPTSPDVMPRFTAFEREFPDIRSANYSWFISFDEKNDSYDLLVTRENTPPRYILNPPTQ